MITLLIDTAIDIAQLLLFLVFFTFAFLFAFKHIFRKKGDKKAVKQIGHIELRLKNMLKYTWSLFIMLVTMALCSLLAIGMIPIIYKLNPSLGMGYAKFASYIIAICLWIMIGQRLPSISRSKEK